MELRRLIIAWGEGEDCWFAIRDMLLDLGFVAEAEHGQCNPQRCHLWQTATGELAFRSELVSADLDALIRPNSSFTEGQPS